MPCGFGRHSGELARRGYSVVGVDLSPDHARRGPPARIAKDTRLRFVRGDMRRLAYRAEFDGVVCLFTSFGYFAERENVADPPPHGARAQAGRRGCSSTTATRAYDADAAHAFVAPAPGRDSTCCGRSRSTGGPTSTRATWLILRPGDRAAPVRESRSACVSGPWPQWRRRLREAGLRLVRAYGDFRGRPFRRDSPRLLLLAERPRRRRTSSSVPVKAKASSGTSSHSPSRMARHPRKASASGT